MGWIPSMLIFEAVKPFLNALDHSFSGHARARTFQRSWRQEVMRSIRRFFDLASGISSNRCSPIDRRRISKIVPPRQCRRVGPGALAENLPDSRVDRYNETSPTGMGWSGLEG